MQKYDYYPTSPNILKDFGFLPNIFTLDKAKRVCLVLTYSDVSVSQYVKEPVVAKLGIVYCWTAYRLSACSNNCSPFVDFAMSTPVVMSIIQSRIYRKLCLFCSIKVVIWVQKYENKLKVRSKPAVFSLLALLFTL